jgi:hypothetical protein
MIPRKNRRAKGALTNLGRVALIVSLVQEQVLESYSPSGENIVVRPV